MYIKMPKISLMIHTASPDNFLINQGLNSYFKSLIHCLNYQTFKDFELVYVDTYYEENKNLFNKLNNNFLIKHVPIHENHRYWYDKGYCFISAAKNTGILYADGDLLITCDDAEFFPENFLDNYWNHYKNGYYQLAVHKRLKNINIQDNLPLLPINGESYINDHRLLNAKCDIYCHKHGNWAFAGTSFSLSDALILNGFNEKMDGCKSLEDCDFGNRLVMLGRSFVTDKNGYCYILDHKSYGDVSSTHWDNLIPEDCQQKEEIIKKKNIENFIAVENYGVLKCAEELYELKANKSKITSKHLNIIQQATIKYRHFDPLADDNKEKLNIWLGTPNFDLIEEREELRKREWKW